MNLFSHRTWCLEVNVFFCVCVSSGFLVFLAMAVYTGVTINYYGKRYGNWRFSWSYIIGWVSVVLTFFSGKYGTETPHRLLNETGSNKVIKHYQWFHMVLSKLETVIFHVLSFMSLFLPRNILSLCLQNAWMPSEWQLSLEDFGNEPSVDHEHLHLACRRSLHQYSINCFNKRLMHKSSSFTDSLKSIKLYWLQSLHLIWASAAKLCRNCFRCIAIWVEQTFRFFSVHINIYQDFMFL